MRELGWLRQVFVDASQRVENWPQWKKESETNKCIQNVPAEIVHSSCDERASEVPLVEAQGNHSPKLARTVGAD
jgi:hypothetical protein